MGGVCALSCLRSPLVPRAAGKWAKGDIQHRGGGPEALLWPLRRFVTSLDTTLHLPLAQGSGHRLVFPTSHGHLYSQSQSNSTQPFPPSDLVFSGLWDLALDLRFPAGLLPLFQDILNLVQLIHHAATIY